MLARIKDISSSEKVLYRQVLDLYAPAIDYNPKDSKAIEKAKDEYKKYQVKTISPVEKEYLETLKVISNKIDDKTKNE